MFDFSKLGDVSKMVSQAKDIQRSQEDFQKKQLKLLSEILNKLDEIALSLKSNGQ